MASVYIIYSKKKDKFYVGSCLNLEKRLIEHNTGVFNSSYTKTADDWKLYFSIDELDQDSVRKIEKHIKSMKSRKYYESLISFPEISMKLISKYST